MSDDNRCLVMVGIDGGVQRALYGLVADGEAPTFKRLMEQGCFVKHAVTQFPSTTTPCVSSMYTGCEYKTHGILDNEWVDRTTDPPTSWAYIAGMHQALKSLDKKLFGWPSILLPDAHTGGQVNNAISRNVKTIYEAATDAGLESWTLFHYIGRGATRWIRPRRWDMIQFAKCEKLNRDYDIYERGMIAIAVKQTRKRLPKILSIYYGGNDGMGHRYGIDGTRRYMRDFIDPSLGRLLSALESRHKGVDFYVTVTADHGQTTFKPEDAARMVWVDPFFRALTNAGYSKVQHPLPGEMDPESDAFVCFGNGAAIGIYLKNRAAGNWKEPPDFEKDVVPALNAFLASSYPPTAGADWRWPGWIDFILARNKPDEPYRVYRNEPPYKDVGTFVRLEEFFAGKDDVYVRPVERIRGIDHPLGPDIKVFIDYERGRYQVCEETFHPGNHGSLNRDDSLIPMIFHGPGVKQCELEEARLIDYAPTAASFLGLRMPTADGRVLPVMG